MPLAITGTLLLSSFFMNRAETAIANDDRKTFQRSLLITAFLGLVFFLGVMIFEWGWTIEPDGTFLLGNHIHPTSGVYGAVLYGMTGMHALHVLSGVVDHPDHLEPGSQGQLLSRGPLGSRGYGHLLALRRPGLGFLLPCALPDRHSRACRALGDER